MAPGRTWTAACSRPGSVRPGEHQRKNHPPLSKRDSKDTTYKFALLRAVIDLSQEYAHLKQDRGDLVEFPLGLLIW